MAEVAAVREPGWLKARRGEAARRAAELDLPQLQGQARAGSSPDLTKLDLARSPPPRPARATRPRSTAWRRCSRRPRARITSGQVDGRVHRPSGDRRRRRCCVLPLTLACERTRDLVRAAPRHGRRRRPGRLHRAERSRLDRRRVRLRPARREGRGADRPHRDLRRRRRRAAPPRAGRARGGRRGRGLGAAPVRLRRRRDAAELGRRAARRPERRACASSARRT